MTTTALLPIFDGHNDSLLRMQSDHISFLDRNEIGGLDLPRAREGGYAGGFFAVYIRAKGVVLPTDPEAAVAQVMTALSDTAKPELLPDLDYSRAEALRMMAHLFRLERDSGGEIKVIRTAQELESAIQNGVLAAILHLEGADRHRPGRARSLLPRRHALVGHRPQPPERLRPWGAHRL